MSTTRFSFSSQTLPLPPVSCTVFDGSPLTAYHPVSQSTVREVLNKTAIKTCELDPLPSPLLAELIDDLLPSFTSVNDSLLSVFKSAVVRPLLNKPLDTENLKNYCLQPPPFLSKFPEKIALLQLSQHLENNNLFYSLQSAYRPGHSTKTALLKIVNDLLAALDVNQISLLSLLDLSAAFDTTDHSILLSRLHHTFGISSTSLSWFQSYLSDQFCQWCFLRSSICPLHSSHFWNCFLSLFRTTVSLITSNCTNLATFLNILKLFIQLSLVFLM